MSSRLIGTRSGQNSTPESRRLSHDVTTRFKMKSMGSHNSRILDQFTRQAAPFDAAASIRNQETLNRIVQWAGAGQDDTVLDVACGPGLLACVFAKVAKHATGID